MICPYCGRIAEPPKCDNCKAAIKAEKPKAEAPKKAEAKPKKRQEVSKHGNF